jgi:hypothetical protein
MRASELINLLQYKVSQEGDYDVVFPVDAFTFASVTHIMRTDNPNKSKSYVLENVDLVGIYEIPPEYDPRAQLRKQMKKPLWKKMINFILRKK